MRSDRTEAKGRVRSSRLTPTAPKAKLGTGEIGASMPRSRAAAITWSNPTFMARRTAAVLTDRAKASARVIRPKAYVGRKKPVRRLGDAEAGKDRSAKLFAIIAAEGRRNLIGYQSPAGGEGTRPP